MDRQNVDKYGFDRVRERRGTRSFKWDQTEKLFGYPGLLPMWVADMDFPSPPEVVQALEERAAHGIYGYTARPQESDEALCAWLKQRHEWDVLPDWITTSPGVVTSLSVLVELLSEPGDGVILQAPVYHPFYDVIRLNGRKVVNNALRYEENTYRMDLEDLERHMAAGAKVMLLCSPHNPGGRVWKREELEAVGRLALKYRVPVISDEIHCDLVFRPNRHIPLASLSEDVAMITATCLAPSKTFNVPGLQTSYTVIPDAALRQRFRQRMRALSLTMENCFAGVAADAAYRHGGPWLDALLDYVQGNIDYLVDFFAAHLPQCGVMKPEGTYLVWVDCRAISADAAVLKKLMFERAGVVFNEGSMFGKEGEGFLRINVACPRLLLEEGLSRFAEAVNAFLSENRA